MPFATATLAARLERAEARMATTFAELARARGVDAGTSSAPLRAALRASAAGAEPPIDDLRSKI